MFEGEEEDDVPARRIWEDVSAWMVGGEADWKLKPPSLMGFAREGGAVDNGTPGVGPRE